MDDVLEILKLAKSIIHKRLPIKVANESNIRLTSVEGDSVYIEVLNLDKNQSLMYIGNFLRGIFSIDGFYFKDLEPNSQTKLQKYYDELLKKK